MKSETLTLILGLSTFGLLSIAGIALTYAYQLHKKIERLESGELDWDNIPQ